MPGRRVPGHCRIRPPDSPARCVCGWSDYAQHTKRSGRESYAAHLTDARDGRQRTCRDCGQSKDAKLMSTAKPGLCKACSTARTQAWRAAHPDEWERHRRRAHLKRAYGITPERYDELLADQDGCCAICGGADADARLYKLHVDHDHATGLVRGLLCGACNRGIGHLGDDPARVERALEYLRR